MAITTKVYANMLAVSSGGRLDRERLTRIADAKSLADAFKMLGDYGFEYTDGVSIDDFITAETNRLIAFIAETAASDRLKNALIARFKYNNAKLAYKSRFHKMPDGGYYDVDFDASAIASGNYDETDKYMRAALESLDEQQESKPQKIDLALTRAMYKYVFSCGLPVVKKYFRAEVDMKNILSAARMKRLDMRADEFISGGSISEQALVESVESDRFADNFEHTPYFEYAESIEDGEFKELWRAERDADDHLFYLTDSQVKEFSSYTPFINRYTEALIELKTAKTALVCIKTNSRDEIARRLPALYR